jgi:hypothetical protein
VRATHGEACLARTRRRRRSLGRGRAELGDDRRAPLVSGSGEGEGAARAAGPAGPRSDARGHAGCDGLQQRGLGWAAAACWAGKGRWAGLEREGVEGFGNLRILGKRFQTNRIQI